MGYETLRSIAAVAAAEAAPATTASGWFTPKRFPESDGLEFAFTQATKAVADNTCTLALWVRQTIGGVSTVVPYDVALGSLASGGTTMTRKQYASIPPGDWYVTLSAVGGTTPAITLNVLVRPYRTQT